VLLEIGCGRRSELVHRTIRSTTVYRINPDFPTLQRQRARRFCGALLRTDSVPVWSQGLLFMATFLAGVFHPALAHLCCNAIGRTALTAFDNQPVLPCVMVTFRAIASLTKRSDSWRMASFDIAGARGFRSINSP
jgi:hypothetical protein